jgi:hypothetical protein
MKLQDLANLILVRDYAFKSVDNVMIKMSRDQVKSLQSKIAAMDQMIVDGMLAISPNEFADKKK